MQSSDEVSDEASEAAEGPRPGDGRRLILLSFLMLFVELALIRWMGSKVVYLSYFSNFVLLGSFLGIGLGFMRANRSRNLFPYFPLALLGLVAVVSIFPVEINRSERELIFFGGEPSGLPIWVILPVIFVAVAFVLMLVAEGVARTFARFEPLEAYRLDILGSIAGVVGFSVLSFLRAPPVVWGALVAVLFVAVIDRPVPVHQYIRLAALVIVLGIDSFSPGVSWSPYYRVHTFETEDAPGQIAINVNGIPHQVAEPIAERLALFPLYNQPYEVSDAAPERVLIIGAGSGNDVAAALAAGAEHVDAVEIDPRIQEIGAERHPDDPYGDERVEVHIDDGRAFLERTDRTYDRIVLALPDSLTLVSGQSSLRLESYLFTREAIEAAQEHLEPDGVFTMYNLYRETWLRDRYANTLQEVFGHAPCLVTQGDDRTIAALSIGREDDLDCEVVWAPEGAVISPATDDHPFPYLKDPTIPTFYLLTIGFILAVSVVMVRAVGGKGISNMRSYVDLFAMGAAFLLLETKSVVQFALLFGTTWFVNALVFAGVLLSVYLAVELARHVRLPSRDLLYGGLLASLVVAWLVPVASLLPLDPPLRFVAALLLAFTPIFFANLIFAQRFRDVGSSTWAFGANLLGAMVGGLVEYVTLITGYRSLLFLVALFYGIAFFVGRKTWTGAPTAAGAAVDSG